MPLIYITGPTDAGKTTVRDELRRRGYEAYDTDEGINGHFNLATGKEDTYPDPEHVTTEQLSQHRYNMSTEKIEQLAASSRQVNLLFLCGAAYNDLELSNNFDKVICLITDKATARQRVKTRTTNDFGRLPSEMKAIMKRHDDVISKYREAGARIIQTTHLSLDETTDAVLRIANEV